MKEQTTLTEKRFFEWHEDDVAVTLRGSSGSYGGAARFSLSALPRHSWISVCDRLQVGATRTSDAREVDCMCEKQTYQRITGTLSANTHPGSYCGQDAYNDMFVVRKKDELLHRKWADTSALSSAEGRSAELYARSTNYPEGGGYNGNSCKKTNTNRM